MKEILKFTISFILMSTSVFASTTGGNGGDVVVCKDNPSQPKVRMLDLYETEEVFDLSPSLGSKGLDWREKLDIAISRAGFLYPSLDDRLKKHAESFSVGNFKERVFMTRKGTLFSDIRDSNHLFLPRGCQLVQIAIQRHPEEVNWQLPRKYIYAFSQEYWNQLDSDNKTALVLHEIVYRMFLEKGMTDSIFARKITGLLVTMIKEPVVYTKSYIELVSELAYALAELGVEYGHPKSAYMRYRINTGNLSEYVLLKLDDSIEYFDDGTVEKARFFEFIKNYGGSGRNPRRFEHSSESKFDYPFIDFNNRGDLVEFYSNGRIKHMSVSRWSSAGILGLPVTLNSPLLACSEGALSFYENGNLKKCYIFDLSQVKDGDIIRGIKFGGLREYLKTLTFEYDVQGVQVSLSGETFFYENGNLKSTFLSKPHTLKWEDGHHEILENVYVEFSRNGLVENVTEE